MNHLMLKGNWLCLSSVVCEGRSGDVVCLCVCGGGSITLRSIDVSTYCQRRLRTSLKYSLCDLKAMPPTSALTHQCLFKVWSVSIQPALLYTWMEEAKQKVYLASSTNYVLCDDATSCLIWSLKTTLWVWQSTNFFIVWSQVVCLTFPCDDTEQTGNLKPDM